MRTGFEGENTHKIAVANAHLCSTRFYLSIGQMTAHFFLHGGPPVFGMSLAVVQHVVAENPDKEERQIYQIRYTKL